MDKVTVHDNNKLQFWLTFLKCDLKMTLPHFVMDGIHTHSTFNPKAKTIHLKDLLHVYVWAWVNLDTSWFDQLLFQRQALAPSTLQGEESPVHRNPMLTVRDYNYHRMYMKHSFCYMTVCTVVTQYIFWVGNNACAVNIAFKYKKWWGLL